MMLVLKCLSQNQKVLTFCWSVFVVDCLKTRNGAGCRNRFKLSAHGLFALEAFKKLNVFLVTRPLYTVRGGRAGPVRGARDGGGPGPGGRTVLLGTSRRSDFYWPGKLTLHFHVAPVRIHGSSQSCLTCCHWWLTLTHWLMRPCCPMDIREENM